MRGRAAQGPSNPASQGFGQAPRTWWRWELQADKSLCAERRRGSVTVLSLYFPARIIHGALRGPTGMVTRPAFRTPC